MKKLVVAVPLIASFVCGGAFAADEETGALGDMQDQMQTSPIVDPTPGFKAEFKSLDTDKNGFLVASEAEADKKLSKQFDKISKDGKLSQSDFIAWKAGKTAKQGGLTTALHKSRVGVPEPGDLDHSTY